MRTRLGWAISLCFVAAACAGASLGDFARGYAEGEAFALAPYAALEKTPQERGALAFTLSDFGGLNTDTLESHAVPWRIAAAALAMKEADAAARAPTREDVRTAMTRFGFLYPESIANWPERMPQPERALDAPMGMSLGVVRRDLPDIRVTTANLACAGCHAGPTFDARGAPQPNTAWLGAPNSSLNLEAYVREIYAALKSARREEGRLLNTVRALYPETSVSEMRTIQTFVLPRLQQRMDALEREGDRPLPFINGAPGATNGVAALRMQLGVLPTDPYAQLRGFTSIPDLGSRGFRSALLYDAAYAPREGAPARTMTRADITPAHLDRLAEVTAFFTVPSMGVHPDRAAAHLGEARDVFSFLAEYEPPRFPGRIDARRAARGRALYAERCASCHGVYDESLERPVLLSFPNWEGAYDTDPARHQAFDQASADAVARSAYGDRLQPRSTGAYAAPLLSGVWMTAPYLHNGAVPTLWHLMNPRERPARFQVGGHRLTYTNVGIDGRASADGDYLYPPGYAPWSQPALIDTSAPGFSNRGHESEFEGLSAVQKRALIEYLKLL